MTTIYTVGHSRHMAEHFAKLLGEQQIATLVDVRSHPASKWAPQFGKAALAELLTSHAIQYVFLGPATGGMIRSGPARPGWHPTKSPRFERAAS
jgi:uncharacterized protein (DUF488 family)